MNLENYLFTKHKNSNSLIIILEDWYIQIGQDVELFFIGGPCAVESNEQLFETAKEVKEKGGMCLRGGCWKPRTDPYSWQGLGNAGFDILYQAKIKYNMPIITEVLDEDNLEYVKHKIDIIQIGARNCQNFSLLKKIAKIKKPVLLKRGFGMKNDEYLLAAEYLLSEGNKNVILCERGIRYFDNVGTNLLDINAIAYNRKNTILPTIVDSSHATGNSILVSPIAKAGIAAGGDGLIIETHSKPLESMIDRNQVLSTDFFGILTKECKKMTDR